MFDLYLYIFSHSQTAFIINRMSEIEVRRPSERFHLQVSCTIFPQSTYSQDMVHFTFLVASINVFSLSSLLASVHLVLVKVCSLSSLLASVHLVLVKVCSLSSLLASVHLVLVNVCSLSSLLASVYLVLGEFHAQMPQMDVCV